MLGVWGSAVEVESSGFRGLKDRAEGLSLG